MSVATERGMGPRDCLVGTGLHPEDLEDPDLEVDPEQELGVIRNLVQFFDDEPGLGAEAGRRVTIGMLGIWGLALLCSPTTREMADIAVRHGYGKFSWVFLRPRVVEAEDGLHTFYDDDDIPADVRDFLIERDLAFVVWLLPDILGPGVPVRVCTTLSGERGAAFAWKLPSYDIRLGEEHNVISVNRETIDAPLPNGSGSALSMCEKQCRELGARLRRRPGYSGRVETLMLAHPAEMGSMSTMAKRLHTHPRTLSRHLEAEGTSFRELSDAVRARLATDFLTEAGLTVQQVADRLGYADAASFTRAFKRWTNRTPGAIARASHAPGGTTTDP